jgi:hypothetical protein
MCAAGESADRNVPRWTVLRQDDNGNRFIVESGLSRAEAERLVKVFEARGHKQLYWAQEEGLGPGGRD